MGRPPRGDPPTDTKTHPTAPRAGHSQPNPTPRPAMGCAGSKGAAGKEGKGGKYAESQEQQAVKNDDFLANIQFIEGVPLLKTLPKAEWPKLAGAFVPKKFAAGAYVVKQGDPG